MKWSVMAPLRVAVLDDHSLIQMALELRLSREADLKVVGVYSNSRDLLASLSGTPADLLVLDYSLGASELDGLHLIGLIRRRFPSLSIALHTRFIICGVAVRGQPLTQCWRKRLLWEVGKRRTTG